MKNYLVKKTDTASLSNILNEMFYEEKMTLQELRFFLVYLSKINPKDPSSTVVEFSLEEYADLLGVELNEQTIAAVTRKLLRYVVCVRPKVLEKGVLEQYHFCQLFSDSVMTKKDDNRWYLRFECHKNLQEQIFELKSEYTSLEVWNIVNLGNFQDSRMYMLLKQYKKIGKRTIPLDELKKMLGIDVNAYPEYKVFARDVLKKCQKALKQNTDLCFDFKAVGRPAKAVHFTIHPNSVYTKPAFLAEEASEPLSEQESAWSEQITMEIPADDAESQHKETIDILSGACDYEFSAVEMEEIWTHLVGKQLTPERDLGLFGAQRTYLAQKYAKLNARAADTSLPPLKKRKNYLIWLLEND